MKKVILALAFVSIVSCKEKEDVNYPKYELESVDYIPDSLKEKHSVWITETVRAASQHMSAGDYEDIDKTIRQAKQTADELYGKKIIGLRKKIDDSYWGDILLTPNEMTDKELNILKSLTK